MTTQAAMPAYPCQPRNPQGDFVDELQPGLTKREHFAGLAMQALIGTCAEPALQGLDGYEIYTAQAAYRMADAMILAALEQQQE